MGYPNNNRGFGDKKFGNRSFGKPSFGDKPKFQATCSKCGSSCEVPFRPAPGKPVFCNNCFKRDERPGKFEKRDFGNSSFAEKRMFEATCAECGNRCEVPFKPTGEKPVYCSQCFKGAKGDTFSPSPRHEAPSGGSDQFTQLNTKLDKIIRALEILRDKKSFTVDKPEAEKSVVKAEAKTKKEVKAVTPKAEKVEAKKPAAKKEVKAKVKKAKAK
jgi:CxxC-x17-CxxC domain-containing protein